MIKVCGHCQGKLEYKGYGVDNVMLWEPYTCDRKEIYYCHNCQKFSETPYKKTYFCPDMGKFIDV